MDVPKTVRPGSQLATAALLLTLVPIGPAPAEEALPEDFFADAPAFSAGDQPAKSSARCGEVRAMAAALPATEARVDLSVTGTLTSIRTDGAVVFNPVYVAGIRTMCVAYNDNGTKPGDAVFAKGTYARVDPDHALLDPCLASDRLDCAAAGTGRRRRKPIRRHTKLSMSLNIGGASQSLQQAPEANWSVSQRVCHYS